MSIRDDMELEAQPISLTPNHTIAVKWPVAHVPVSHPGSVAQQLTSLYHPATEASMLW